MNESRLHFNHCLKIDRSTKQTCNKPCTTKKLKTNPIEGHKTCDSILAKYTFLARPEF
jgi:hypothetical protein